MRGFAVIDAQPGATNWAVWLTSQTGPAMVEHTNAVALDQAASDFTSTLDSLLACRHVLLTSGSDVDTLPVARFDDLTLFSDATAALHADILTAIAAYKRKTRNANLAIPDMPPARAYAPATNDTPTGRPSPPRTTSAACGATGWKWNANGCAAPPTRAPAKRRG